MSINPSLQVSGARPALGSFPLSPLGSAHFWVELGSDQGFSYPLTMFVRLETLPFESQPHQE